MRSPAVSDVTDMFTTVIRLIKFPYVWLRYGSPIKADETVVLFPQSASVTPPVDETNSDNAARRQWTIPVHAWVVEKEDGALSRLLGRHSLLSLLDLLGVVSRRTITPVFENRLSWFMADREVNKKISVVVGGEKFLSPRSGRSGHIRFSVPYFGDAPDGSVLKCELTDFASGATTVHGQVQLVPEKGVSVISDIDDTIKISQVTNKRELVRGLFFDDYHPTPGMPEFYQQLSLAGACFHYVSASPWQLYPSLAPFLDKYFPFGCLSQRHFYVGDKSFVRFFRSSVKYKTDTVSSLIERYPQRKFILIGDSGENDPEVYLDIAGKYQQQVTGIFIREVYDGVELENAQHEERWVQIKSKLASQQRFNVIHDPAELGDLSSWLSHMQQHEISCNNKV